MKKKQFFATMLSAFCVLSASSCSFIETIENATDSSKTLCSPASVTRLSYQDRQREDYLSFKQKANTFAAKFAPSAYRAYDEPDNFVVSPVSVFLALGMAAECADGNTQAEILSALDLSLSDLRTSYPLLYRDLNVEHTGQGYLGDVTTGRLNISNSLWLDNDLITDASCLETLGEQYYCYGKSVDFDGSNEKANRSIQKFVKQKTNGLINRNFQLDTDTLFALLNTLYLKDIWNESGSALAYTSPTEFTEANGTQKSAKLLTGYYESGRPYVTETYTGFYTVTYNGYKLKFLLPNDGYTVDDVFTEENLSVFNAVTDFNSVDDEAKKIYSTRCLFPEYTTSYNRDVQNILKNDFGICDLFDRNFCDFGTLTNSPAYCSVVTHSVSLTVDKKGIEGAAVTLMGMCGAAGPGEYEEVYLDFTVNKAFGFLLTNASDVVIFSGIVKSID